MRILLIAVIVAASPALARADLRLDWPGEASGPSMRIDVPDLSLGGVSAGDLLLMRDGRGGRYYTRTEPVLCLILGIIPGFGVGHLLAGSPRWVVWLVVDVVIAVVFWGPFWYWPDHPGYFPALSLLVLVERIFEGVLAYQAAGGGYGYRMERGLADAGRVPPPALAAIPVTPRNGLY